MEEGKGNMSKVITFTNLKGGVAKTVSTLNIGMELAENYGLRVLLVDLDPQNNLCALLSVESETLEKSMADVMVSYTDDKPVKIEDIIIKITDNLYLAPSAIDLAATDLFLNSNMLMSREYVLKKVLKSVEDRFDVVLIDTQPSLSLLPLNALCASDYVVIPASTEYLSYRGMKLMETTFNKVRKNLNENLKMLGLIATRHEGRNSHNIEILELLEEKWRVLGVVPKSVKISDAAYEGGAVVVSAPKSKPAVAYKKITETIYNEILK